MCEVLPWVESLAPHKLGVVAQTCNPGPWEVEEGGSEVKVILGYMVILRLALAT